jgi:dienelactone hydrolase
MPLPTLLALFALFPAPDPNPPERGSVRFVPVDDQKNVPELYRLDARTFKYELTFKFELHTAGVRVEQLTFPSPVQSPHPENNTVYAEYYHPNRPGPYPAVIVLDITGGDQSLSRGFATALASRGIGALFVQMAYYGPRRPPGSKLRLLSPDLAVTFAAFRQTVLDLRLAAAWLESRPEVDGKRLGIMGTSLGSFVAALTAEMEPRLGRCAVLLGGGGFVDGYYDHPRAAFYARVYESLGGSKESLRKLIAPIDPLTCAANLQERKLLIMAARNDTIVPPCMAEALWQASGKQQLVWFPGDHYTAIVHITKAIDHLSRHFGAE